MAISSPPPTPGRRRRADAPHEAQLPSGRHGLTRDFVVANQRERIMMAMAEVADRDGYAAASVERVAARAGVSRRTFYEQFEGKDDAYGKLYAQVTGALLERVAAAAAAEDDEPWLRRCLGALLGFVAADPALARLCIVQVLVAGPDAVAARDRLLRDLAALVERLAAEHDGRQLAPLTAEGLVGAIYDVLYNRVAPDRIDALPEILDDLHTFSLTTLRTPRT